MQRRLTAPLGFVFQPLGFASGRVSSNAVGCDPDPGKDGRERGGTILEPGSNNKMAKKKNPKPELVWFCDHHTDNPGIISLGGENKVALCAECWPTKGANLLSMDGALCMKSPGASDEPSKRSRGRPRLEGYDPVAWASVYPDLVERARQNRFYAMEAANALGISFKQGSQVIPAYRYLYSGNIRHTKWSVLAALGRIGDPEAIRILAAKLCKAQLSAHDAVTQVSIWRAELRRLSLENGSKPPTRGRSKRS